VRTLLETPEYSEVQKVFKNWNVGEKDLYEWMKSESAREKEQVALQFTKRATEVVGTVERTFGRELPGALVLMPSFGDLDGFARYDHGRHTVLLGIDFPDADEQYLQALTAHELSHVYRDHSPEVWAHLGKPLESISRNEYLENGTAEEHLMSEGLATLFSMTLFPEISLATHHYYSNEEYEWCTRNHDLIEESFRECLNGDKDVWSYYSEGRVAAGSPSRTQYYWAAHRIAQNLSSSSRDDQLKALVDLHGKASAKFPNF
jgi:hypothetical protein